METDEDILRELNAILESPHFATSAACKVVLDHYVRVLVEWRIQHRADRDTSSYLKHMDQLSLPKNRVTIGNTKDRLEAYYQEHPDEPVRIKILSEPWRAELKDTRTKKSLIRHYSHRWERRANMTRELAANEYYRRFSQGARASLQQYHILVNGKRRETSVFTSSARIGLRLRPAEIQCALTVAPPPPVFSEVVQRRGEEVFERLRKKGVQLPSQRLYRLLDATFTGRFSLRFSEEDFLDYFLTSGLLEDELQRSLIRYECDIPSILLAAKSALPLRNEIFPSLDLLLSFGTRFSSGGPGVLLALARSAGPDGKRDFLIPIERKSDKNSDVRGMWAVIPKGFHSGSFGHPKEVQIENTIYRRFYQQVFNGSVEGAETFNSYMVKPELRYFAECPDAFDLEVTGFAINTIGGDYEVACLLAIRREDYLEQFEDAMSFPNWERDRWRSVSSRDPQAIAELLLDPELCTESVFHITESLIRLQELAPSRVKLPEIRAELVPFEA